jgi:hypothetical protein
VFHRRETLEALAEHSDSTVHYLIGYKGQEPVGILPVFEKTKLGVTAVFSPPPDLHVTYLGPALLNMGKLKQRKTERRHEGFVDGSLEWVDEELSPRYTHLRTSPGYDDLRPYNWKDFSVDPYYTYRVDLTTDPDDLVMEFSSDARKNVRNTDPDRYRIEAGDEKSMARIFDRVRQRYDQQDETYILDREFVLDLYDALGDAHVRPYECFHEGSFVGGIIALENDDTIYRWQGSVDFDVDIPVNDLLDWHLIEEGMERGRSQYDLVGANTNRLNDYKAKFAPELVPYYGVEDGHLGMRAIATLYKQTRKWR